jgi:quercetin dioxygenase-like cupin family protein
VALQEHENPGEATVMVLSGRITLASNGDSWEARTGDLLLMPAGRSRLSAIEDSAVLLSVAKLDRPGVPETAVDLD